MTDNQKNLLVTLCVCFGAGAIILGVQTRDRLDMGGADLLGASSGALASREDSRDIPASQYFSMLTGLLEKEYVDDVNDETKLAAGAVRGMITSLSDTHSVYYDEKTFPTFMNELQGKYEGIGADLIFVRDGSKSSGTDDALETGIPKLMVASVVPGGPAQNAGVKPGDWVESINDIWVVNPSLQDKANKAKVLIDKKQMPPDKLRELRTEIREKTEKNIPPLRAREKLTTGVMGSLKVVWHTAGGLRTTNIEKAKSSRPDFEKKGDGSIAFRFVPGISEKLAQGLKGESEVTLDLRGIATGDYQTMLQCLEAVAPKGNYGYLGKEGDKTAKSITVTKGISAPLKIKIMVDSGTRGVAEVFAKALASQGKATIVGISGNDPVASNILKLPTGSGYTLAIGRYSANGGGK